MTLMLMVGSVHRMDISIMRVSSSGGRHVGSWLAGSGIALARAHLGVNQGVRAMRLSEVEKTVVRRPGDSR